MLDFERRDSYEDIDSSELVLLSDEETVEVTVREGWIENFEYIQEGMEVYMTEVEPRGSGRYGLSGRLVVEPRYFVDVTDVRSWVQCPRMYYLNKISGTPLKYPVVKGTLVHQVFDDLLHGVDAETAIEHRVEDSLVEIEMLGRSRREVTADVRRHASAIQGWLDQKSLLDEDDWRSEVTLTSPNFGLKGRCDAIRRGSPVELKTGKSTRSDPYFQDKIQAAAYALLIGERRLNGEVEELTEFCPSTGTVIYTKNSNPEIEVSPAKTFSINDGLLDCIVRKRNEIAMYEYGLDVPTGYEADADCHRCFERDTCMVVSGKLGQESKVGTIVSGVPSHEKEYFREQYGFIEGERSEVHDKYSDIYISSLDERVENDRASRVEVRRVTETESGYRIEVEAIDNSSKIRAGNRVLASNQHPIQGEVVKITEKNGDLLVLESDVEMDVDRLDVYPSEIGVSRMLTALHDFLLKSDERKKNVFFGKREPRFRDENHVYIDNNERQNDAVNTAVNAHDLALIHGPPGTGKTYTLAKTVEALTKKDEKVLLSSFTNRAVDNALEEIRSQNDDLDIVRLGTESGVRDDMAHLRLESSTGRLRSLRNADVVAATTTTCGSRLMRELDFDAALVDEASQLTDPQAFAAINLAQKYVLVGDHRQLPPVSGDDVDSVFEKLIRRHPDAAVKLEKQYRMAQRIQSFPSRQFYDNDLFPANGETAGQKLTDLEINDPYRGDHVQFVHVDGQQKGNTNPREAATVQETVEELLDADLPRDEIGVVAPYRAQVSEIQQKLDHDVTVDTVDRFQGSSKETVILSFTATGELDGPLFDDHRRLNVALTRAKKKLILIGDREALETRPVYRQMLNWAEPQ